MIVEIEDFALMGVILDECQIYSGAISPDSRPLGTYETKMDTRTGKRSILTVVRKNRGL